jgi:hypothetical protein
MQSSSAAPIGVMSEWAKVSSTLSRLPRYRRPTGHGWLICRAVDKAGATVDFLDGQAGSQGSAAFLTQGDRKEWKNKEDHDRQERCQHGEIEATTMIVRSASRSVR